MLRGGEEEREQKRVVLAEPGPGPHRREASAAEERAESPGDPVNSTVAWDREDIGVGTANKWHSGYAASGV